MSVRGSIATKILGRTLTKEEKRLEELAVRAGARRALRQRARKGVTGPPEVMTMGKAAPVIIVAILFDLARLFFGSFWFFGPAMGAALCTAGIDYAAGIQVTGAAGTAVASLCGAAAVAGEIYLGAALVAFGTIVAFNIAVLGWLTVFMWLLHRNPRIFAWNTKEIGHAMYFLWSIFLTEIPIIGCAPIVSAVVYRAHKYQIKMEKAVLKEYEEEQAALANQDHQQQMDEVGRLRAVRQAQANAEEQRMAELEEIPEEELLAA